VIIRNELQLLIVHPRVQEALNKSWAPSFDLDRSELPRLRWIDLRDDSQRETTSEAAETGARYETVGFGTVARAHWNSRRRAFVSSALFYVCGIRCNCLIVLF
jgi:hypothetical protein